MKVVLTLIERELINEVANRSDVHNNTRTMVCDTLDGVEKWFDDGNQSFDITPEVMVRVQNIFDTANVPFEVSPNENDYAIASM